MVALTAFCLAFAALLPVTAALQEANCTSDQFGWVFNSFGQSPCRVAEDLVSPCSAVGFNVPALPSGDIYFGPTKDQADACRCSSVFYSLLSACAACQDAQWIPWSIFNKNCTRVWLTVYSPTIPPDTSVPHWAYYDVSGGGSFDPVIAKADAGPESSRPAAPSSTSSRNTATRPTASTNPFAPTQSSAAPSPHPSNAGAIAGGVIGGVVGVALIAVIALLLYRRNKGTQVDHLSDRSSGRDVLSTSPPPLTAWTPFVQPTLRPQTLADVQEASTLPWQRTPTFTGATYDGSLPHLPAPAGHPSYTGAPEV